MCSRRGLKLCIHVLLAIAAAWPLATGVTAQNVPIDLRVRGSEGLVETLKLYEKSYALVIGIDAYSTGWPRLSKAVADARAVAEHLKKIGFEVALHTDSTDQQLEAAFKDFVYGPGADRNARAVIWFAGHGHTIDGEGYLVPSDAPRASPETDAQFRRKSLSLRRFGEYMREMKSRHVLAVFDSCFAGTVFDTARGVPPPAITKAVMEPVRQFVSSGDADQVVADNGRFRELFLAAIDGREPHADVNRDGYLTGTELGLFLADRVANLTSNAQTPRYGKLRDQSFDRGDVIFELGRGARVARKAPSRVASLSLSEVDRAWAVTKDTTSPAILEAFIRMFGGSAYADLARARLTELRAQQHPPASTAALDREELVRKVQELLKILGYDPGEVDGRLGPKTRSQIEIVQVKLKSDPDGQATRELLEVLDWQAQWLRTGRVIEARPSRVIEAKRSTPASNSGAAGIAIGTAVGTIVGKSFGGGGASAPAGGLR